MSPIVYNGKLIAHVGGDGDGALIAFDLDTGAEAWRWSEDGPGYSSPVIVRVGGRDQLVTQTEQNILAVDGEWQNALDDTLLHSVQAELGHSVAFGDTLVFGGTRQPTFAVRVTGSTPAKLWESTDATLYMSTPVRIGQRLCGFTRGRKGPYSA
ncbi:MAG: hypothetical protein R2748_26100 [Bryobacterales bacterium]